MDGKPNDDKTTILELEDANAADKPLDGCVGQYGLELNRHTYGTRTCNDKKLDLELANNMSINPEIKPGVEFTPRAIWHTLQNQTCRLGLWPNKFEPPSPCNVKITCWARGPTYVR